MFGNRFGRRHQGKVAFYKGTFEFHWARVYERLHNSFTFAWSSLSDCELPHPENTGSSPSVSLTPTVVQNDVEQICWYNRTARCWTYSMTTHPWSPLQEMELLYLPGHLRTCDFMYFIITMKFIFICIHLLFSVVHTVLHEFWSNKSTVS